MTKNNIIKVKSLQNKFYKNLKQEQLVLKIKSFRKIVKNLRKQKKKRKKQKLKKELFKGSYGVIHLLCNKRNIFCTLSDKNGQIKASVSTGILKVKGKKRKGFHYVPKTSQLLINYLFKIKFKKFLLQIKGTGPKKKKRILINSFFKVKKFKFLGLKNLAPRSHNGCRPPKIRRK